MKTLIAAGLAASVLAGATAASAEPMGPVVYHHEVPHGVVMMVAPRPVIHRHIYYGPGYVRAAYYAPAYYGAYGYGHGYGWRYGERYGWRARDHHEWRDHDRGDHRG